MPIKYTIRIDKVIIPILLLVAVFFVSTNAVAAPEVTLIDKLEEVSKNIDRGFNRDIAQVVFDRLQENNLPEKQIHELMLAGICESGMSPTALNINANKTKDSGVFQINSGHNEDPEKLKDPIYNTDVAIKLYKESGLKPWYSRPCIYKGLSILNA